MREIYSLILNLAKSLLSTQSLAKLIASSVLKLAGFRAWIAQIIITKVLKKVASEVAKEHDKVSDLTLTEQLQAEMRKDLKDIDWQKVDRLEREIMGSK